MTRDDTDKLAEQLSAYLDGELNEADRARVEARLRTDATARARLDSIRETVEAVGGLPRRPAPTDLAADVMAAIERGQLLDDKVDPPAHRAGWRIARSLLLTAALVTITVTAGLWGLNTVRNGADAGAWVGRLLDPSGSRSTTFTEIADPLPPGVPGGARPAAREATIPKKPTILAQADPARPYGAQTEMTLSQRDAPQMPSPVRIPAGDAIVALTDRVGVANRTQPPASAPADASSGPATALAPSATSPTSDRTVKKTENSDPGAEITALPLRLNITCADADDLRWCRMRLDTFLADRTGVDRSIAETVMEPSVGPMRNEDATSAALEHVERRADLTERDVRTLMGIFDAGPSAHREVAASVGDTIRARGWSQTQQLLSMIAVPERTSSPARARTSADDLVRAQGRSEPDVESDARSEPAPSLLSRGRPASGGRASAAIGRATSLFKSQPQQPTLRVIIRLTVPKPPPKPPGLPGRLVPDLTKDPQDP